MIYFYLQSQTTAPSGRPAILRVRKQGKWLGLFWALGAWENHTAPQNLGAQMIRNQRSSLGGVRAQGTSDFCVAPDRFLLSQTKGVIGTDILHYYLFCNQSLSNPFQQIYPAPITLCPAPIPLCPTSTLLYPIPLCPAHIPLCPAPIPLCPPLNDAKQLMNPLTIFQRSLTTMQIQIQGLLQFAVPLFPTAERDLLGVQHLLNSSEASLHQLTALLDCRGLNKDYLDAMVGVCYDGVEGTLYLCLFSSLAACAFTVMLCAIPRAWRQIACKERDYDDIDEEDPFNPRARRVGPQNPNLTNMHSFCSYSSSMGSQSSLHPPAPAVSAAPVSDYTNQNALFGGTPRFENVPLIGRGSPPPSYSPTMRATYLSMTEEQRRQTGNDFQA
ncbi:Protein tweety -like protein 2 [Takifugu flavidus]|uniref:Protein tweety homolog n=1 Tax=Takifugu flavidus TaxID=433684 RepID=A0A5C6PTD5_9TELE|nr:Protein tweety -like protein 2 [Takifugu flavidus]